MPCLSRLPVRLLSAWMVLAATSAWAENPTPQPQFVKLEVFSNANPTKGFASP